MSDETRDLGAAADVNILKEKTFNRELQDLVDRVTDNEGEGNFPEEKLYGLPDDIPDTISDRDILYRLHQLFYHARHLPGIKRINTSFNPFTDWTGTGLGERYNRDMEAAGESLTRIMKRLKIPSFAVLSYDLGQKCYTPDVCTMDGIDEENLLMNIRDDLVRIINLSEYGHILEPASIENDSFLKARFMPSKTTGRARPLYCVSLDRLTGILSGEINGQAGKPGIGLARGCLLLAFLEGKWADAKPEAVCEALQAAAALPLLLVCEREFMDQRDYDFGNMEYIQGIIEYYSVICSQGSDISGLVLSQQGEYTPEGIFYLSYLKARLRAMMSPDTALIRLTRGIFLIITTDRQIGDIKDFVKEYNRILGDPLAMETINDAEFHDPRLILHRLLY